MMQAMFKQKGATFSVDIVADPAAREFIEAHTATLDESFSKVDMSEKMRRRLSRSNYIFSGMKTFHELHEAFPSMFDENGNRKSFERFLKDVRSIDQTYNVNYLRAEYNFVNASARAAAKWESFAEDGDRYNLQYRTQSDDKVRPEHAALNRVTLPPSDPFWEEFYPPNGWNCRCSVVQVLKSRYPTTPHDEAMGLGEMALQRDTKGIFRFNPGKQEKAIPDYNPYTIRRCRDCDIAQGNAGKLAAFIPDNELCQACRIVRAIAQADVKNTRISAKPLQGTYISNPDFTFPVRITRESIREWTNQPHKHFLEKNEMLLDIGRVFSNAKYLGTADNHKNRPRVVCSHVFEVQLCNELSLILVTEYEWGEYILHSISDSERLYQHIKRK